MKDTTFSEAIDNIASSIADEQEAISSLLDQEALKIQKVIDLGGTPEEILLVNQSVNNLIKEVNNLETLLNQKLELIKPYLN